MSPDEIRIVDSAALAAPRGAYSHVVRVGDTVYTSGFGPFTTEGPIPEGIVAQTEQALDNVETALAEFGLSLADVVKTTLLVQHLDRDFARCNEVWARRFGTPFPVRTIMGVDLPGVLVAVDAMAVRRDA
jgi:2-iminobutanoate/2-iminopropanoate deaminase